MRILSQDGKIDVNYDLGNLSIASGRCEDAERASVYFHSCSCPNATRLAEYTSVDKARKAMEMLHEAYSPVSVIKEHQEGLKQNIKPNDWLLTPALPTQRIEVDDNFYFQFPQDSEMEE